MEMSGLLGSIMRHCPMGKVLSPTMLRPFTSSVVLHCKNSSNDSDNVLPKKDRSIPNITIAKHPFSLIGAPLRDHAKEDVFAVFKFSGTQYKATVVSLELKHFLSFVCFGPHSHNFLLL